MCGRVWERRQGYRQWRQTGECYSVEQMLEECQSLMWGACSPWHPQSHNTTSRRPRTHRSALAHIHMLRSWVAVVLLHSPAEEGGHHLVHLFLIGPPTWKTVAFAEPGCLSAQIQSKRESGLNRWPEAGRILRVCHNDVRYQQVNKNGTEKLLQSRGKKIFSPFQKLLYLLYEPEIRWVYEVLKCCVNGNKR